MASDFAAYVTRQHDETEVEEYTPSQVAGEVLLVGDFAEWDDANNWMERAPADPTAILGISEVVSEFARTITPDGKIPLRKLSSRAVIAFASATQYVEATHRNQTYGITRNANGHWLIDVAKTGGDARVLIIDGDSSPGSNGERANIWYGQILSANLALDGIAS